METSSDPSDNPAPAAANTFIVRIWREWSSSEPCWRGFVLHLHTGQRTWFQDPGAVPFIVLQALSRIENQPCPSSPKENPPAP